jgi:alkylhydroperoxidase family enzyme
MTRVSLTGAEGAMRSMRVRAHCPELQDSLMAFYERLWESPRIEATLKELIRIRCAFLNACRY